MKVVLLSHGHPSYSKGGAELAAYYMFDGLNRLEGHDAWLIARADDKLLNAGTRLVAINEREFLIRGHAGMFDLAASADLGEKGELAQLLRSIDPDVVHFHHYVYLGVDALFAVKRLCPRAHVVLTLHEYIAICLHNGQMVKTSGELCYKGGLRECQQCFPHLTQEDVFLRDNYVRTMFGNVDRFVSPSQFLKSRYVEWGLDDHRIDVIENGLPDAERLPPRPVDAGEGRSRFAYFGQINPYKGVDLILEAFARLPRSERKRMSLRVFGTGLTAQTPEFQDKIRRLLAKTSDCVSYHGAYEPWELPTLMRDIDWVVVGSIWWENSPLVIQEAFKYGRPVICPDIGGMAEKVIPGEGGLHFRARDSVSLASLLTSVSRAEDPRFDRLQETLPEYPTVTDCVNAHLVLYRSLTVAHA